MAKDVMADPHGAGEWKIGRSEHGKRVILFRHTRKEPWSALDIHITGERADLWLRMFTPHFWRDYARTEVAKKGRTTPKSTLRRQRSPNREGR